MTVPSSPREPGPFQRLGGYVQVGPGEELAPQGCGRGQELCLTTTLAPGRHHLARLYLDPAGDRILRWVNLYEDQPDGSQSRPPGG